MEPSSRRSGMRSRTLVFGLAMLLVAIGGCSSEKSADVTFLAGRFGVQATSVMTATGPAADRGMVCDELLVYSEPRFESGSGEEVSAQEWNDLLGAAIDAETVHEGFEVRVWNCADGSGSFEMSHHTRVDLSQFHRPRLNAGTWRIIGGTGAYSGLTGSGDVVVEFESNVIAYSGEITTD
jgi:hypothetical protein